MAVIPVRQAGAGSSSSWKNGRPGAELADQRGRDDVRPPGTAMGRTEGHQGLDPAVAALTLDVVPRDQATEAVADHGDPVVAGLRADVLDVLAEIARRTGDVGGQGAVVPGADGGEPAPAQVALHHGEDGAVVDQAVHEEDGGAGGQRVVGEQGPHAQGHRAGPDPRVEPQRLGARAERVHEHVGADPGELGQAAGDPGRAAERAQAASWRARVEALDVRVWRRRRAHGEVLPRSPRQGRLSRRLVRGVHRLCSVHVNVMPGCGRRHTGRAGHAADRYRFVTVPAEGGRGALCATPPEAPPLPRRRRTGRSKEAQAKRARCRGRRWTDSSWASSRSWRGPPACCSLWRRALGIAAGVPDVPGHRRRRSPR